MRKVPLGDIAEISIGRTPSRGDASYWGPDLPWLTIADMNQGRLLKHSKEQVTERAISSGLAKVVPVGTVLMSFKLTIGRVGITTVPLATNEAIAAFTPFVPAEAHTPFLAHALQWAAKSVTADRAAMGLTLNKQKLAKLLVPWPSIDEQRRITDILERAENVVSTSSFTIAQLGEASRRFGDYLAANASTQVPFGQLITGLSNGISPSTNGGHVHSVHTLSAVTRGCYDPSASKEAGFARPLTSNDFVQKDDFLICRGNGNPDLVASGVLVTEPAFETAFPDTVFRARLDQQAADADYLQAIWASRAVRDQVLALARTTNGTFKINQQHLKKS